VEPAAGATAATVRGNCNWCAGCGGYGGTAVGAAAVTAAESVVHCLLLRKHVLLRVCVLLRAHVLLLVGAVGLLVPAVGSILVWLHGWALWKGAAARLGALLALSHGEVAPEVQDGRKRHVRMPATTGARPLQLGPAIAFKCVPAATVCCLVLGELALSHGEVAPEVQDGRKRHICMPAATGARPLQLGPAVAFRCVPAAQRQGCKRVGRGLFPRAR
jgi:hypothetical protein